MQEKYKLDHILEKEISKISSSYELYINALSEGKHTREMVNYALSGANCCQKIQDALIQTDDPIIMKRISENRFLSEESQIKILMKNNDCFQNISSNPKITHAAQEYIINNLSLITYMWIFRNPCLDRNIQKKVIDMSHEEVNKNRSPNQVFFNKKISNKDIKMMLSWNYGLDKEIIMLLATDSDPDVRAKIALRDSLDEDVKQILMSDEIQIIRDLVVFGGAIYSNVKHDHHKVKC